MPAPVPRPKSSALSNELSAPAHNESQLSAAAAADKVNGDSSRLRDGSTGAAGALDDRAMGELAHMRLLVKRRHASLHCTSRGQSRALSQIMCGDTIQVRSLQAEVFDAQKALKSLHADKQQSEAALQVSQVVLHQAPLLSNSISSFFVVMSL